MTVFTKQAIYLDKLTIVFLVSFPDHHFVYWGSGNETSISLLLKVTICLVWGYMWEGYRGHVIPCTTATHMRELVCVYCKERQSTWDKYEDSLLPTRHVNLSLCSSFVTGSWHSFYHNHTHKMVKPLGMSIRLTRWVPSTKSRPRCCTESSKCTLLGLMSCRGTMGAAISCTWE